MKKTIAMKGGSYALVLTAIVLALLIVLNILACALPANLTKLDISSSKLYSVTSNTKAVVNALEQDVTIYWIVQSGQEDDVIENLLAKYDSLSSHIDVVKRNPDVYPTFAQQYTDETVQNNSLVVVSGEKYRFVPYSDIYVSQGSLYSYSYSTSFDGEGAITSAIDYVVSTELPKIYVLEGHGESALPDSFAEQLEKENVTTESLSLLTVDEIPEDAAALMLYAPDSDISQEEAQLLEDYVRSGGKLFVSAGPVPEGNLDRLYGILSRYGITVAEGIVSEGDRSHYAFQAPYVLLPELGDSDITQPLSEKNYYAIVPIAAGMELSDTANGQVTPLLTTTDAAYSKLAGYAQTTYDKEEGDLDGPFALGVEITDSSGGQIVFFTSSYLLEDMYNAYSSGANSNLVMNALSSLLGERQAMSIRSKSLNYNYLTISDSTASLLKAVMIGLVPIAYLAMGVATVWDKRRMQR